MTNEEAIRILEPMKSEMLLVFDHDRKEALKLAITALRAQNVPDTNVGDTISRQALKNTLTDWQMEYAEKRKDVERLETLGAVIDLVTAFPTVDHVNHGKWIKDNSLYKCSACNDLCTVAGWANCIPEEQMYKSFKFCPNCGADMRGEEDE